MTTDRLTKMPDGCAMCADGSHSHHLLHLHARCHMHAPVRLTYRRTGIASWILTVTCFIPGCARPMATFGISEVIHPVQNARKVRVKNCDLCGDNDARRFRSLPANMTHEFTAPFRMELHRAVNGSRSLHVFCYVEECNRAFAVLGLVDEGLGVVDGGPRGSDGEA